MNFPIARPWLSVYLVLCTLVPTVVLASTNEPKPRPENTIHLQSVEPVKPQTFARPLKFFIGDVIDRSGNAQPMLVFKPQGGIFLDRAPVEIMRGELGDTLKAADLLATDRESADFQMNVYLFSFGLSSSSGLDFFGKVEFTVQLKNVKTGKTQQITASGTSIGKGAFHKKNLQKNIQENIELALTDSLRNLLRGEKLRDVVAAPDAAQPQPAGQSAGTQTNTKPL